MTVRSFTRLALVATLMAIGVVVLGAYVRLSHAGLSCPDWPGCYGQIGVPEASSAIAAANAAFPERPVDVSRAWKEMAHRYLAGVLGLLVLAIAIAAWRRRHHPGQRVALPVLIVVLVACQALLGMWTVTLLLKPLVVTAHLIGGVTIAALLWWLTLRHGGYFGGFARPLLSARAPALRPWVLGAVAIVLVQIFLGGWTSTNYAAPACPDFPLCQGKLVPPLDPVNAFTLWHGLGIDYEGGILASDARVTIHFVHRIGALVALVYVGVLSHAMVSGDHDARVKRARVGLLIVLLAQVSLGIGNVLLGLPIAVAVAHNGFAALLLLTLVSVYHIVRPPEDAVL